MNQAASMIGHILRSLRRELGAGELRLLLLALVIGVASLASVGFFVDRLERALDQRKAEWQGGDLLLASGGPAPPLWLELAAEHRLKHSESLTFRSVVLAHDAMALTEVKAVDQGYPLRGALLLSRDASGNPVEMLGPPSADEVWVEDMLLHKLGLAVGDQVSLGKLQLRIGGLIRGEPDAGAEMFNLAPRIIVHRSIIPASGLVQPGSRVKYRLAVAGERSDVERFRAQLEPLLKDGEQIRSDIDERSGTGAALARAERFLRLVALIGFVLAGVAVGMSAHRYALRHVNTSAVYRCLGASTRWVTGLYAGQLLVLGLIGSLLGGLLGYLAQFVLEHFIGALLSVQLPPPGFAPLFYALGAGLVITLGFGFAPIYTLRKVQPARILRADTPPPQVGRWLLYLPPLAVVVTMMLVQAQHPQLAASLLAGVSASLAFLVAGALLMIHLARRVDTNGSVVRRFALVGLTRRPAIAVVQVVAVGIGLMVLLLLSIVSRELLEGWRKDVPGDAPNHFAINIQHHQLEGLEDFFRQQGLKPPEVYPMVRGRLVSIDGQAVSAGDYQEDRAKRLVQREFNLSWSAELRGDNPIVAGEDWNASQDAGRWSVEEGIAEELGIALGDTLVFDISGRTVAGRVANLRKVRWDSFQVNFFVIAAPGLIDVDQATYITAFYLPSEQAPQMIELIRQYPNITDINVEAVLQRVRSIIEQVTRSVEFISAFTLAAGFLVLLAAVQTSMDERLKESAILRVLGASRREIQQALILEFALLGMTAGLLAALGAWLAGYLLAEQIFQVSFGFSSRLWFLGPLAGVVGMVMAGLWATRRVVNTSPMGALRQG